MTSPDTPGYALAVTWEARPEEADHVAAVLREAAVATRTEPGCRTFLAHRSAERPAEFFLYEVYDDAEAFAAHQRTEHFKRLVLGEAVPRLLRRERVPYVPL